VYVAADRFASLKLGDFLPKRLNCWDGAVRIYWPQFSLSHEAYLHRVFSPEEIQLEEERRQQGFKEYILGWMSNVAVYVNDADEATWSDLEARRRRAVLATLKDQGDYKELCEIAAKEIEAKEAEITDLKEQLAELSERLKRTQQAETSWRQAYVDVCKSPLPVTPTHYREVPIESVDEAIDRARERFSERVLFALNGKSKVNDNPFEGPGDLFAALEFLATTYFDSRVGKMTCEDFDGALRRTCGWFYRGDQSELTMNKYREWYTTKLGGKTYWLGKHVGTGTSKDARYTIRIGFEWDGELKKVVVGFVGQHPKTDAT
jgi:hypothetical protein